MIKTIEVCYTELETYLNKPGYTFLCNYLEKFIFKYKQETSRQLKEKTNTEKFFELDKSGLKNYAGLVSERLGLDFEFTFNELEKFRSYRLEKSEGAIKCKWQKQTSFEVPLRLKNWLSNLNKNNNNKKGVGITEI